MCDSSASPMRREVVPLSSNQAHSNNLDFAPKLQPRQIAARVDLAFATALDPVGQLIRAPDYPRCSSMDTILIANASLKQ